MNKNKWFLNGGRGSGRTLRLLCETYENQIADLEEELKKWKKEWQEQVQKATDEGYARTLQTMKLTKAKKLLKKVITDFHNMDCVTVHIDKTIAEAEQFISEVAK